MKWKGWRVQARPRRTVSELAHHSRQRGVGDRLLGKIARPEEHGQTRADPLGVGLRQGPRRQQRPWTRRRGDAKRWLQDAPDSRRRMGRHGASVRRDARVDQGEVALKRRHYQHKKEYDKAIESFRIESTRRGSARR